jgi:hypothetical protein
MSRDKPGVEATVQRINVTEPYDVRRWSDRYACTPRQLKDAIAAVGNIASEVQRHLVDPNPPRDSRAAIEAAFHPAAARSTKHLA